MRYIRAFTSLSTTLRTTTTPTVTQQGGLLLQRQQQQQQQLFRSYTRTAVVYPPATSSTDIAVSTRQSSYTCQNNIVRYMSSSTNSNDIYESFPRPTTGLDVKLAIQSLIDSDIVCFDVDSTVITEEGIDVLADYLGKGTEVAALTAQAMEGGMKFQDALSLRLNLLQPSKQQILNCITDNPLHFSNGVEEFIYKLQNEHNKIVYLVSGGFRIMIEPIAEKLNIPKTNIIANTILFDDNGNYKDFDDTEPTSQDMGKPKALQQIQQKVPNAKTMVMIGDGATDAQAKPPAKAFIGYGGIAVREKVQKSADWFITDFQDLIHVLDNIKK